MNPVGNLRDCPPFKSEHRDDLTPAQRQQWRELCATVRKHFVTNELRAIDLLQQAIAIDDQYASLDEHYFLKGQERLRGLRGWAEGGAERLNDFE